MAQSRPSQEGGGPLIWLTREHLRQGVSTEKDRNKVSDWEKLRHRGGLSQV